MSKVIKYICDVCGSSLAKSNRHGILLFRKSGDINFSEQHLMQIGGDMRGYVSNYDDLEETDLCEDCMNRIYSRVFAVRMNPEFADAVNEMIAKQNGPVILEAEAQEEEEESVVEPHNDAYNALVTDLVPCTAANPLEETVTQEMIEYLEDKGNLPEKTMNGHAEGDKLTVSIDDLADPVIPTASAIPPVIEEPSKKTRAKGEWKTPDPKPAKRYYLVKADYEKIEKLYIDDGKSMEQVSEELGIQMAPLSKYLQKSGLADQKFKKPKTAADNEPKCPMD